MYKPSVDELSGIRIPTAPKLWLLGPISWLGPLHEQPASVESIFTAVRCIYKRCDALCPVISSIFIYIYLVYLVFLPCITLFNIVYQQYFYFNCFCISVNLVYIRSHR